MRGIKTVARSGPPRTKKPSVIVVCNIAGRRLNHKGQEPVETGEETDLGQREPQFVDEKRKQGRKESRVEISGKVDQRQSENNS